MTKSTIKIQGMTCNHCVMRAQKAIKAVAGVQDAQVDLQKAEAVVSFDEAKTTAAAIAAAVTGAGYKATA